MKLTLILEDDDGQRKVVRSDITPVNFDTVADAFGLIADIGDVRFAMKRAYDMRHRQKYTPVNDGKVLEVEFAR